MKIRLLFCILLLQFVAGGYCLAQPSPDSILAMSTKTSQRYLNAVSEKSEKISGQIDKQTEKYLAKLEKQEAKLKKKLGKIDSLAANNIFANSQQQYQEIQDKLKNKSASLQNKAGKYLPWLDSAGTSLKFLDKNPVMAGLGADAAKLTGAMSKVKELENQFKQAASVKEFIQQRKAYLKEQLQRYELGNELKKYNQTVFLYASQIDEYRQAVSDPQKAERKVLELLNKLPAFQQFMKKNSLLSSLFAIPGADEPGALAQNMAGLQTRASVQNLIQGQLAAGGPGAQAMFQQNMQEAQGMLSSLKNKIAQYGSSGGSDLDMPEYKPNTQKTKTFLKRIEYGANIQSTKSSYFFPAVSDIALTAGYRLNDKSVIGIGASYKMGWGKDIQHINISSQGLGLRSFLDMKLKGSFYASAGFEYNYQPVDSVSFHPLQGWDKWGRSGLIGVSKIVSLKTKYFKKTKLQLLWDVLSYSQTPRTPAVKLRVGYSF